MNDKDFDKNNKHERAENSNTSAEEIRAARELYQSMQAARSAAPARNLRRNGEETALLTRATGPDSGIKRRSKNDELVIQIEKPEKPFYPAIAAEPYGLPDDENRKSNFHRLLLMVYLTSLSGGFAKEELKALAAETDYFSVIEASLILDEAISRNLLDTYTRKDEPIVDHRGQPVMRVGLTALGQELIDNFRDQIPEAVKDYVGDLCGDHKERYRYSAKVTPGDIGRWKLNLYAKELSHSAFYLSMETDDEDKARALARLWNEQPNKILYTIKDSLYKVIEESNENS